MELTPPVISFSIEGRCVSNHMAYRYHRSRHKTLITPRPSSTRLADCRISLPQSACGEHSTRPLGRYIRWGPAGCTADHILGGMQMDARWKVLAEFLHIAPMCCAQQKLHMILRGGYMTSSSWRSYRGNATCCINGRDRSNLSVIRSRFAYRPTTNDATASLLGRWS